MPTVCHFLKRAEVFVDYKALPETDWSWLALGATIHQWCSYPCLVVSIFEKSQVRPAKIRLKATKQGGLSPSMPIDKLTSKRITCEAGGCFVLFVVFPAQIKFQSTPE